MTDQAQKRTTKQEPSELWQAAAAEQQAQPSQMPHVRRDDSKTNTSYANVVNVARTHEEATLFLGIKSIK